MYRIGIFFGGQSREREIAFAGGRTVYDNLNKSLFEPIPVFVDSLGNFIQLDWEYIYKGSVRDFYPPADYIPDKIRNFQHYIESLNPDEETVDAMMHHIGRKINPEDFPGLIDFAFLAMHGPYGEDGSIQGMLEWYNIPYSGSGILGSGIGISKSVQKNLMQNAGFNIPEFALISRREWFNEDDPEGLLASLTEQIRLPMVVKASGQGSSLGVGVLKHNDINQFTALMNKSFFIEKIHKKDWQQKDETQRHHYIRDLSDIKTGIGLPVTANGETLNEPNQLWQYIDAFFQGEDETLLLESINGEQEVIVESFITGKEFSCIVIQNESDRPVALPPTEIRKENELFDYRSKYLPGMSSKITPINLPDHAIASIRQESERLFNELNFNVYARIDGFYSDEEKVYLNDPNTTSGMLPSSFFFHQAAEIGLDPSQFLTYLIRTSLTERLKSGKHIHALNRMTSKLDEMIISFQSAAESRTKVAVIMGGYSSERHISVESGRNIYEKLASSTKYEPFPVFLTGDRQNYKLYKIPVNIMLKDNADDIRHKIEMPDTRHPVIEKIEAETLSITRKYAGTPGKKVHEITLAGIAEEFDEVFIALHGRPGEDGQLQKELDTYHIPYNGSDVHSSSLTINKYETNKFLRERGFLVANHRLVKYSAYQNDPDELINTLHQDFVYPFIAKPADDGCSAAVKKIHNREELDAFIRLIFRTEDALDPELAAVLNLKYHEEFPRKEFFMIEELIDKNSARRFLEITGGLLTHLDEHGSIAYEIFEPSEALSSGEVLSLEEKFLAGEGQNITPARFADDPDENRRISEQVKNVFKQVAQMLEIEGYARIDAFVRIYEDEKVDVIIIEINSLPGMTPATCIFHQCAINGYKPYDFIDAILEYGRQRSELKKSIEA